MVVDIVATGTMVVTVVVVAVQQGLKMTGCHDGHEPLDDGPLVI